jgi:hypothetical protein
MPEQEENGAQNPRLPWLHGSDGIHCVDLAVDVAHLTSEVEGKRGRPASLVSPLSIMLNGGHPEVVEERANKLCHKQRWIDTGRHDSRLRFIFALW